MTLPDEFFDKIRDPSFFLVSQWWMCMSGAVEFHHFVARYHSCGNSGHAFFGVIFGAHPMSAVLVPAIFVETISVVA